MVSIGRTWITHSLWTTEPAQRQRPGPRATPSVGALVRGRRPRRGEADAASGKQERNALSVYARSTEPRRTLSQDAPVGLRVVRFAPRRLSSTPRSLWRSLARPRDRGAGHDGRARRRARASPQAFAGGRRRVPVNSAADRRSSHSPAGDALTQLPRGRSTIGLGMCSQCPASPDLALPARVAPLSESATTAARPLFLRLRLVHRQAATFELLLVERGAGGATRACVGHLDESEAA